MPPQTSEYSYQHSSGARAPPVRRFAGARTRIGAICSRNERSDYAARTSVAAGRRCSRRLDRHTTSALPVHPSLRATMTLGSQAVIRPVVAERFGFAPRHPDGMVLRSHSIQPWRTRTTRDHRAAHFLTGENVRSQAPKRYRCAALPKKNCSL